MKRKLLIMAAAFALLLTGCGAQESGAQEGSDAQESGGVDYAVKYNLKINPEFEVLADEELNVVSVEALNEDAEAVLSAVDVNGLPVVEAFSALTEEAKAEGYMTEEKGNTVNISIEEMDEETMKTCPVCEGCGTVECWACHGSGGFPCEPCGGIGTAYSDPTGAEEWQTCPVCHGAGYATTAQADCWACHGSGVCYLCGGSGCDIVTNEFGETVYTSDGVPETYTCTFCHGSGSCTNCLGRPCNRCNNDGTGERPGYVHESARYEDGIECPGCGGTGIVPCGCELNGYRWCPCCWGSGIDGTGYENYDYSLTPEENFYNNR